MSLRFFVPILAGATLRDRALASAGAIVAIAATATVGHAVLGAFALPFLVAPIGASAVLVFAVPASPLAQPWSVWGGNVVSAAVGLVAFALFGNTLLGAGLAVGGAIFAMSLLRCLHPPGGAAALTAVIGGPAIAAAGLAFPFAVVALNSAILVAAGWLYHRRSGHSWPHRVAAPVGDALLRADIDRAITDLGETFDIDAADLEALLERAEHHAALRRAPPRLRRAA